MPVPDGDLIPGIYSQIESVKTTSIEDNQGQGPVSVSCSE